MTSTKTAAPKLFASVRTSRDLTLAAFAAALLAAFALQAGAFLPDLLSPGAPGESASAAAAAPAAPLACAGAPAANPCG